MAGKMCMSDASNGCLGFVVQSVSHDLTFGVLHHQQEEQHNRRLTPVLRCSSLHYVFVSGPVTIRDAYTQASCYHYTAVVAPNSRTSNFWKPGKH